MRSRNHVHRTLEGGKLMKKRPWERLLKWHRAHIDVQRQDIGHEEVCDLKNPRSRIVDGGTNGHSNFS
jgi:hypothetical protein